MRAKLIHHDEEWLPGEFESPALLVTKGYLRVWCIHRYASGGLIGMKIERGTGVWNSSGRLLRYFSRGADLAWSRDASLLWSLECRFGKCPGGAGVRHVLKSRDPQSFEKRQETEICVPTGGVRYLVLNHRGDRCLATWLEQHAWGYVGVDLNTMAQMVHGLSWPSATLAAPEFSGDDAYVVSCHFAGSAWWNDELADPNIPSPGGIRKVGTISVQDIENGEITQHDVFVEVPQGWIPDRPDYSEWYGIWGPEFVSDQEFRIWLPDNTAEILKLPLPERVHLRSTLGTHRQEVE